MIAEARSQLRQQWVESVLGHAVPITPLAGDASFRRYFRVQNTDDRSYVLMDAPPPQEDVRPFLAVRDWLDAAGLRVSALIAEERTAGLLLLEDFGDVTWARFRAAGGDLAPLFTDALRQLSLLQAATPPADLTLPPFDAARMHRECDLYLDWYLPHVVGHKPDEDARSTFHAALAPWIDELAALPRVPVHLDYHSRNLMLPPDLERGEPAPPLGVIDYQDAVLGPLTYDLASLLYDCYQDYPEPLRRHWSHHYFAQLPDHLVSNFADFGAWHRAVRLTALQRHIKAIGIFARLAYRDGKRQFLDEIPLTRKHLHAELDALSLAQLPLLVG